MVENSQTSVDYSVLTAFDQGITRPRTSFFYHAGLIVVAVTMVLLPLIYLAIVLATAWAVYYHATHNWSSIMGLGGFTGGGRIVFFKFLIYFVPLVVGAVVVFFLFKPLFARRPKQAQPLALNPASEPLLYAFIEKICATVGAPSPKRIDRNCELNAAAAFRRGLFSLFGNDLVLVIGLPLAGNLSVSEFAGVIAHEFGHFTQGAGLRLSYVIRRVNLWFLRVAYERDAWDVALERWSLEVENGTEGLIIWTAQIGVGLSRLVLRLLMFAGHAVGGFMLRQMEYDADAYEIKVSGSEAFETTQRKLATLSATLEHSYGQMHANWKKFRTLPDNLPEVLRRQHEHLPPAARQKIDDTLGLQRTGLFDSHPSAADRIRQARQAADPGIFHDERPATMLFTSFEHPARFVTLLHYTDDLNIPITRQMLTEVRAERTAGAAAPAAPSGVEGGCEAYFFGLLPLLLPLRPGTPAPSANWEADLAELNQLTSGLRQVAEQLAANGRDYTLAEERLLQTRTARCLMTGGLAVDPASFGGAESTMEAVANAEREASETGAGIRHSLREVTVVLTRRLELGIALALADAAGSSGEALSVGRVIELVTGLDRDAETYPRRKELAETLIVLNRMKQTAAVRGGSTVLERALEREIQAVITLSARLGGAPQSLPPEQKTGLRLQTAPKLSNIGEGAEVTRIEAETRAWFADYRQRLEELVKLAASAETAPV